MLKSFIFAITFLACAAFSASAVNEASAPAEIEVIKEDKLGAGKRVKEKIVDKDGSSGTCESHYQGLGQEGVNSGKRYRKIADGTWQYDGDWKRNGDDIDCYGSGTEVLVWTNEDMGKSGETLGSITDILGGDHGSWADA